MQGLEVRVAGRRVGPPSRSPRKIYHWLKSQPLGGGNATFGVTVGSLQLCCGMWFTPHMLSLLYVHRTLKLYLAHLLYIILRIEPDLLREKALQARLYS